jgi:hypothetical protein
MAHRVAPQVAADLDDIWYFVAIERGSVEIASRLSSSRSKPLPWTLL